MAGSGTRLPIRRVIRDHWHCSLQKRRAALRGSFTGAQDFPIHNYLERRLTPTYKVLVLDWVGLSRPLARPAVRYHMGLPRGIFYPVYGSIPACEG